jgi:hypothetical protein
MQTEVDLDAAVAVGIINEAQALALRNFEAGRAGISTAGSEKFQIYGGLTDIMSAAGLTMAMFALARLCGDSALSLLYLTFPLVLFALAKKINTHALPFTMMAIMLGYLGFTAAAVPIIVNAFRNPNPETIVVVIFGIVPALIAGALFWRKFRFPPAPAAMAAMLTVGFALLFEPEMSIDGDYLAFNLAMLVSSLCVLAAAFWFDLTDIRRETERSQVAFWLHCCAGFLISRSVFAMLNDSNPFSDDYLSGLGGEHVGILLAICLICALISLMLDRRSLLISTIMPSIVIIAEISDEATGLLLAGIGLLFFTWGWSRWRQLLLQQLPEKLTAQLPRTEVIMINQRPTRQHLALSPRKISTTSKGLAMLFGIKSR